jgi:hypothetical protein
MMNYTRLDAWLRQVRGTLRVLRGRLFGDRREIIAGRLDQAMGRVAEAHVRANQQTRRHLAVWRARHSEFFARRARHLPR